jgi:hypothetical protein
MDKLNSTHIMQIVGIILVAIFLVYMIFSYFYFSEDQKLKKIMNNYLEMKLPELTTTTKEECHDTFASYYLSDFYIASSANSFLVGNQKYDYVSLDMIKNVLIMGARYIELELLNDSIGANPKPVITTGYQQGQWQTSLNYIDFEKTCLTISEFAFSHDIKTHQLPLFIYIKLKINNNPRTIDQITKILNQIFPDAKENPKETGNRFPTELNPSTSKICSLFNQVVIWSDPLITTDWSDTDKEIEKNYYTVINKYTPIRLHHTEVHTFNDLKDLKDLKEDSKITKPKTGKTPEDHRKESDKLTEHNRTNLSIVYPSMEDDSQSLNYDPNEGWSYGCQFVALNYQISDNYRQMYFNKFINNSFVLKPNGLRVIKPSQKITGLHNLVPDQKENKDQIRHLLYNLYDDQPIYLRPFADLTKVLSHSRKYLEILEKPDDQITLDECFLIKESLDKNPNCISLVASTKPYLHLTQVDHTLIMDDWRVHKNNNDVKDVFIKKSSFIPMNGFSISRAGSEKPDQDNLLSFYTSGSKKDILSYHTDSNEIIIKPDDNQDYQLATNSTFHIFKLPVKRMYTIRKTNGIFLKPINNLIKAISNDLDDDSLFEFINESDTGLIIPGSNKHDYVHIKNKNGGFWTIIDQFKLRTNAEKPGKFTRFYINKIGSINKIHYGGDDRNLPLFTQSDNIIRLARETEVNTPETYFIFGKSYMRAIRKIEGTY